MEWDYKQKEYDDDTNGISEGGTSTINSEKVQLQACKTNKKQQKNAKLNGKRIATKSAFSLTILLLFTTTHTHTYKHEKKKDMEAH